MKYYFTFGCGQKHENGYHIIEADDVMAARMVMNERFGTKWASQYESAGAAGVEEDHLHEVLWPQPEMFTTVIYQNGERADELNAELRTVQAARIYVTDCVKVIIELTQEHMHVTAQVLNPAGNLVWWMECGDADAAGATLPLELANMIARLNAKLFRLTEAELEHTEFACDAFIKGSE